jgi:hypothetical protein
MAEAEKKEAEDDPLKETAIPSPRVMAKKSSHAEAPQPTATEQAENNEIK